jgi:hypothetical protein
VATEQTPNDTRRPDEQSGLTTDIALLVAALGAGPATSQSHAFASTGSIVRRRETSAKE